MITTTEKVLQRLAYEKLILVAGVTPQKKRIRLHDILGAGKKEPRVLEVLPAILVYNPKILYGIEKDLRVNQALKNKAQKIMNPQARNVTFFGIPAEDCRRTANTYATYLRKKRRHNRSRLFNLRLSEKDWQRLQEVTKQMGLDNYSETIRTLIAESSSGTSSTT